MCFLNERCESHHSPRDFSWAGLCTCGLQTWSHSLSPIHVWHSMPAVDVSMVSRERPRKQIARSSTKSALKMSLAIQEGSSLIFSPKHVTARTPPVGTPSSGYNSSECRPDSDSWVAGPWDILTQKQAVCLWGQSYQGLGWCHIARLSRRLSLRDQLPVASEQRHPGDTYNGSPDGRSCYDVFWNHTGFCLVFKYFSRYQIEQVLIMRSRTSHRQLVSAVGR